jgi:hypothetical protein
MQRLSAAESEFRFLTEAEFRALHVRDKAVYLARAAEELDRRQRSLRARTWPSNAAPSFEPAT